MEFLSSGPDIRNLPKYKHKKKFSDFPSNWHLKNGVYVHPEDTRPFPEPVTLTAPSEFEFINEDYEETLKVPPWGFVDHSNQSIESFMQRIMFQNNDLMYYQDHAPPIEQFVHVLTERKKCKILESPVSTIMDRTIVVKITMPGIDEDVLYRVVELPASISLAVMHDKILSAVMGWCRAYHGYVFLDIHDGAVLGPKKNSGYIDMMHASTHYYAIGDDRKFPLVSLINQVGDTCHYIYDLGDQYTHCIELMEIKEEGYKPRRNVTIIDGKGACPPGEFVHQLPSILYDCMIFIIVSFIYFEFDYHYDERRRRKWT